MSEMIEGGRAITALKRVSAYRTSDGEIHETRAAAELREAEIAVDAMAISLEEDVAEARGSLGHLMLGRAGEIAPLLARLIKAQKRARSVAAGEAPASADAA